MSKTGIIMVAVVGILAIVLIVVISNNRRKTALTNAAIQSQMMAAQTQAAVDCQKSWYCVASNLIGGVGSILGGVLSAKP